MSIINLKAKIRKIGNSFGIIIPKELLDKNEDEWQCPMTELYVNVITNPSESEKYWDFPCGVITENNEKQGVVITKVVSEEVAPKKVITESIYKGDKPFEFCPKHKGFRKVCGCL